jgi:isoleucyl-tRNA synthetase
LGDHLFQLMSEHGADVWFDRSPAELLPPGEKCAHCGGAELEKETDILDGWFDSGSSFAGVMEERPDLPDTADMYLEGSDQHRGWFHSSLLIAVGNRSRPPYREVLTHGYVVDQDARKMSKSLGNTLAPENVIRQYGADILRLWAAAENYQDDIRISAQILDMLAKAYFNYRNTSRFILGNLYDFDPVRDALPPAELGEMERFILHQANQLAARGREAYERYEFHTLYHLLNNFVVEFSAFYLNVIKDTLYTRAPSDPRRRGAQTAMREILSLLTRLVAPILSFTAEEIWGYLPGETARDSVFLEDLPKFRPDRHEPDLARRWEELLKIRALVNREIEAPRQDKIVGSSLDAEVEIQASGASWTLLKAYEGQLAEIFIVSGAALKPGPEDGADQVIVRVWPSPHPKCPRCWIRQAPEPGEEPGSLCGKCRQALAARAAGR